MTEVQDELGLGQDQKDALKKAMDALRPPRPEGGTDFRSLSEEERTKRFEEMRKQGEEIAKKSEAAIKEVLDEVQLARLNELRMQREGTASLLRPEVQDELKLSDEQKEKVKTLSDAVRPQFGRGFGGGGAAGGQAGPDFRSMSEEERQKYFDEQRQKRDQAQKDLVAVLNADQKAAWEAMQGEKFTFPEPRFGGGRGRGGEGGGRGAGGAGGRPPAE